MAKLIEEVEKRLKSNIPLEEIKRELAEKGFKEKAIYSAIDQASGTLISNKKSKGKFLFITKEIFDRIGYGFGSQQFINILFFLTGASFFIIGLVNGIKVILSTSISLYIQQFSKVKVIGRKIIGISGIVFGFSFLLLSAAIFLRSVFLFSVGILLGSLSIVPYGDIYQKLAKERDKNYMRKLVTYGLIITALSLFVAAFLMDLFPITGTFVEFAIFGKLFSFRIYGYLIAFEVTALSFILSGYILSYINLEEKETLKENFSKNFSLFILRLKQKTPYFLKNKAILMLIVAGSLTSVTQTIGNSYYGIFVYNKFMNIGFGGFLNVAMVFLIAVFSSIFGSAISKIDSKAYGKFPTLVFGTLLMAIMPLTYYYKPNLILITMGTILGVIGAAIVGVANGLLSLELVNEKERSLYFSFYSLFIVLTYLILIPILSYFTQLFGLSNLFLLLTVILVIVALLYVITVAIYEA